MKNFVIVFALIMGSFAIQSAFADTTPITIKVKKKGGVGNGSIGRAPMNLPIEATFDDATGVLTVSAPEDMEGCVYVYNISGGLEASSQQLNCTLTINPSSDIHVISLQGETWIGEAKIIF